MPFSIGVFTRLASSMIMFDNSNTAPMIAGAHSSATAVATTAIMANSMISAANRRFTRIVYTNGVLNFSRHACTHATAVIPARNPKP